MLIKTILVFVGFYLLWHFFHRPDSLLRESAVALTNEFLFRIFITARAIFLGSIMYFFIVVYGNLDRISSISDLITIVTTRPSRLGLPALLGIVIGALFTFYHFLNRPSIQPTVRREVIGGRTLGRIDGPGDRGFWGLVKSAVRTTLRVEQNVTARVKRFFRILPPK